MAFMKLNQRKTRISTPWLLRTFLAVQLLITFTSVPVMAEEGASSQQTEVKKGFDCCGGMSCGTSDKISEKATPEAKEVVSEEKQESAPAGEQEKVSSKDTESKAIDKSSDEKKAALESSEDKVADAKNEKPSEEKASSATNGEEQKKVSTTGSDSDNLLSKTDKSSEQKEALTEKESDNAVASDKKDSTTELTEADKTSAIQEVNSTKEVEEPKKEALGESVEANEVAAETSNSEDEPNKKLASSTESSNALVEVAPAGLSEEDDDLAFLKEGFVEKEDANVIYIDNDEVEIVQETIAYEDLPTDDAKTRIKAGSKFPVVMVSNISSKTAKKGDILQARLKYDLKIGPKLIAKKGALVTGHIDYNMKARTVLHSMVSPKRWYRNSGCIGLMFDEIINGKGEHIALNARPARMDRIIKNKAEGRLLGVNHAGQITGPWGQQLKYKAVRVGLNAALAPAGVFSFGAMPVALGVMGAVNPSFAFMKPVGTNVPHRRIKGFCWGFLSGIPGSWIIEDTVTKGQEALVRPGDEFLVELHQEFTGKVLTEAQLLPGASGKVAGDVDDDRLEKTKKRGIFKFRSKDSSSKSTSKVAK